MITVRSVCVVFFLFRIATAGSTSTTERPTVKTEAHSMQSVEVASTTSQPIVDLQNSQSKVEQGEKTKKKESDGTTTTTAPKTSAAQTKAKQTTTPSRETSTTATPESETKDTVTTGLSAASTGTPVILGGPSIFAETTSSSAAQTTLTHSAIEQSITRKVETAVMVDVAGSTQISTVLPETQEEIQAPGRSVIQQSNLVAGPEVSTPTGQHTLFVSESELSPGVGNTDASDNGVPSSPVAPSTVVHPIGASTVVAPSETWKDGTETTTATSDEFQIMTDIFGALSSTALIETHTTSGTIPVRESEVSEQLANTIDHQVPVDSTPAPEDLYSVTENSIGLVAKVDKMENVLEPSIETVAEPEPMPAEPTPFKPRRVGRIHFVATYTRQPPNKETTSMKTVSKKECDDCLRKNRKAGRRGWDDSNELDRCDQICRDYQRSARITDNRPYNMDDYHEVE